MLEALIGSARASGGDPAYGDLFRDFLSRYDPAMDAEGKLENPPRVEEKIWRRLLEFLG